MYFILQIKNKFFYDTLLRKYGVSPNIKLLMHFCSITTTLALMPTKKKLLLRFCTLYTYVCVDVYMYVKIDA